VNIWIFNHYATAPSQVGGTRHYDLASQLVQRGHRVTIFASSFNHFSRQETQDFAGGTYFKEENLDNINYLWIKTSPYDNTLKRLRNILDYTFNAYRAARNKLTREKPDIIIGSSVHPLAAYLGYALAKKAEKPFYFEERDLWPQTFVDFGKLSKRNPVAVVLYAWEKFLYKKATRIIVLFQKATGYVASRGINPEKIIFLPNGVNLQAFRQNEKKQDQAVEQLMQPYKYKVVYTGSHGIANHLEPLLETAHLLQHQNPDIQFILVGDGPKKNELQQKAAAYQLTNLTFADPVPKEKIPFLLSLADLSFISMQKSPLYKWGFSMNKIYDYMAAGLPIMLYSSSEVVGDFQDICGVELAESPQELAAKINTVIFDVNYKQQASQFLKAYVEEHFSWEKLALKLEKYMLSDCKQELSHAEKNI